MADSDEELSTSIEGLTQKINARGVKRQIREAGEAAREHIIYINEFRQRFRLRPLNVKPLGTAIRRAAKPDSIYRFIDEAALKTMADVRRTVRDTYPDSDQRKDLLRSLMRLDDELTIDLEAETDGYDAFVRFNNVLAVFVSNNHTETAVVEQSELETLRSDLASKSLEIVALQQRVAELEPERAQVAALKLENVKLAEKVNRLIDKRAAVERKLDETEAKRQELVEELDGLVPKLDHYEELKAKHTIAVVPILEPALFMLLLVS